MTKTNLISADHLSAFAENLLTSGGFNVAEAKAIAASLVLSETLDYGSHGVIRIKEYIRMLEKGMIASGTALRIAKETPNSLTADGCMAPGQAIMPSLLDKLYTKLKTQAVVSAAGHNCGHLGRIGEWVEGPAQRGYAALLFVNGNGQFLHVAPPGGKKGVTDTNPLAFAIPMRDEKIFAVDMSTSALAFGKIRLARLTGKALPPDCIQDAEGHPTTDPNVMFADPEGSMLPMGGSQGYKGFALSMLVDLLASGLSGGQTPPQTTGAKGINNFSLTLWNPAHYAGLGHMQSEAEKYIAAIRASPPIDPAQPIRLPGDRANAARKERERYGIPLETGLVRELSALAEKLSVKVPKELAD